MAAAAALLLIGGCGGGGSSPGPPPVPSPSGSPVPFPLQGPNTTVIYSPNSASVALSNGAITSSRLDPTGGGSTITATTDVNDNLSSLQFNIVTPSGTFTHTFSNPVMGNLPYGTLGDLAYLLNQVNTTSGSSTYLGMGTNVLVSSHYGVWATNSGGSLSQAGVYAYGNPTPVAAMPTTGAATYNGTTVGMGSSASGPFALAGSVQLQANFANSTVTTTIYGLQFQNLATSAVTLQPGLVGTATINGNQYSGPLSGAALSGSSTGTFYGPIASETTGVWRASGGGTTAIGSYGAH
jgi:hypothetical protein